MKWPLVFMENPFHRGKNLRHFIVIDHQGSPNLFPRFNVRPPSSGASISLPPAKLPPSYFHTLHCHGPSTYSGASISLPPAELPQAISTLHLPSTLPSFLPSFLPSHSLLPSFFPSLLPSFPLSFLPSFPLSFLPSFPPSLPPSFLTSLLPYFLTSFLPSFLPCSSGSSVSLPLRQSNLYKREPKHRRCFWEKKRRWNLSRKSSMPTALLFLSRSFPTMYMHIPWPGVWKLWQVSDAQFFRNNPVESYWWNLSWKLVPPTLHSQTVAPSLRSFPPAISQGFTSIRPVVASLPRPPNGALPKLFPRFAAHPRSAALPSRSFQRSSPQPICFAAFHARPALPSRSLHRSSPKLFPRFTVHPTSSRASILLLPAYSSPQATSTACSFPRSSGAPVSLLPVELSQCQAISTLQTPSRLFRRSRSLPSFPSLPLSFLVSFLPSLLVRLFCLAPVAKHRRCFWGN